MANGKGSNKGGRHDEYQTNHPQQDARHRKPGTHAPGVVVCDRDGNRMMIQRYTTPQGDTHEHVPTVGAFPLEPPGAPARHPA